MNRTSSPIRAIPAILALLVFAGGTPAEVLAQREARDDEYAVNDVRVQHRSYVMEETGETIPYALFVPSGYDPSTPSPLMVSLHGAGRQFDWLMNYAGFLDLADQHGYVVVTPLGYTRRGGYGYRGDSEQDRRAEQDVMNVFELVTKELNIDENRIYLWGHSMGGAGTYYIASRHPEIWAGLAAVAGGRMSADYVDEQAIRHIPFLVIQGSDDQTVPAAGSRASVARMRELGMQHLYVEIPGGDHSLFISRNPDVVEHLFSFFDIVSKGEDAGSWEVPRTSDGHPDLQGNWTNMSLTPFEREEGRGPVFMREEVEGMERQPGVCPAKPGTIECGRVDNRADESLTNERRLSGAEYNEVYWDRGSRVAIVNGQHRTSFITHPTNGRVPPLTPEGERRIREYRDFRAQFGSYDHPELRPLGERCVINGGTSGPLGPPMVPKTSYNGNYTIVQTADHIMIMAEMIHDARIIRIGNGPRLSPDMRPWFGDSWAHWEGDALVVETTNLDPRQSLQGIPPSQHMKVTERFTRVDEETILYEFTIEDPTTYSEPWGGDIPLKRFHDLLYEYACHEGNYSFSSVLSGARYQERMKAEGR
jgi:poly(3-hydroxybutyrate) depolymerase